MTEQKYLEVKDTLGAPNEAVHRETSYLKPVCVATLVSNGTGQTGSIQTVKITKSVSDILH